MRRPSHTSLHCKQLLVLALGCVAAMFAGAPQAASQTTSKDIDWDQAFVDHSGTQPLHFVAEYNDVRGHHRLEEWRTGLTHLRRQTDDRIDLHADATAAPRTLHGVAQPVDYVWQIIDVQQHVDNRISSAALLHAGLLYNYYAMAHVLSRPAGRFRLAALPAEPPVKLAGATCTWYELTPEGQAPTRVCWSPALGIPLETRSRRPDGAFAPDFQLRSFDHNPIPAKLFAVDTTGLQIHDHDEMAADD